MRGWDDTLVSMGLIASFPLGIGECPTRGPSGSHAREDQVSAVVAPKQPPKIPGDFTLEVFSDFFTTACSN